MTHDPAQDRFDIACLRGIKTDAHARRHALAAAMIKLHALSIARELPRFRDEALEIVDYAQQLYAERLTREAVADVVRAHLARSPLRSTSAEAGRVEDLIDALWTLISTGRV